MAQATAAKNIFKKLSSLEQQVQKLKVQAYLNLPKKQKTISIYPENMIMKSLAAARNQIWKAQYAKRFKSIS
jgi:hypothetical protein